MRDTNTAMTPNAPPRADPARRWRDRAYETSLEKSGERTMNRTKETNTAMTPNAPPRADLVRREGDRAYATSLDIARCFGKQHRDVTRTIRNMECSDEFRLRNFAQTVYERENPSGGRPIPTPYFEISRDGFAILVMGFTGNAAMAWKETYIAAFNAMERRIAREERQSLERDALALRRESLAHANGRIEALSRERDRMMEDLARARRAVKRMRWSMGPMRSEEYKLILHLRRDGLAWTEIAREYSFRSAKSLSRHFRNYGEADQAEG